MGDVSVKQLIAAQTAQVTAKAPYRVHRRSTFMAGGATDGAVLAGGEEVDFFYSVNGGDSWHTLNGRDGSPVVLSATLGPVTLYGPMLVAVTKDATSASVGVFVDEGAS